MIGTDTASVATTPPQARPIRNLRPRRGTSPAVEAQLNETAPLATVGGRKLKIPPSQPRATAPKKRTRAEMDEAKNRQAEERQAKQARIDEAALAIKSYENVMKSKAEQAHRTKKNSAGKTAAASVAPEVEDETTVIAVSKLVDVTDCL